MCGLNKAASARIIMAACVMIAMVAVGHRIRMLRQVNPPVLVLPFGQNLAGGIEQGSQKDIRNGDRKSEELRYSTCHQRYDAVYDKCPWTVKQLPKPSVRPSVREQHGRYYGGQHCTELSGVSGRIDIVEKEQQYHKNLRVELTGFVIACHGPVKYRHERAAAPVQCHRQKNR